MRGTDAVAALSELMPVALGVDERIDWSEVEAAWGTRFPSDYVRFMEVYGSGEVGDVIGILLPAPQADGYPYTSGLEEETENARATWEMCRDDAGFDVAPESIVAWGVTSGADIYCWVTTDDDPDRWPVLVCGRHTSPEMQLHRLGMAEFLLRLLTDEEFQDEAISVVVKDGATFVNWRNR
ncbi:MULTISPECIES: SMI1/KNR4 family protein [Streptomyces]|uniref:SMI1/KNR4 family protein n=1 Tax=Streptomyces solicathayae TaxID=3081768 RepID=A0ABZ0LWS2_9ACTN|nr:SMI1/KNR4 family protein [Streptomyces sp. HUAS YS2]WOX23780.1 SMI1/KNR4 family protein [Streptomyces sp. HUAS YS2]